MTADSRQHLRACADLLHREAASRMEHLRRRGDYHPDRTAGLRRVAELEELAAVIEAKLAHGRA